MLVISHFACVFPSHYALKLLEPLDYYGLHH